MKRTYDVHQLEITQEIIDEAVNKRNENSSHFWITQSCPLARASQKKFNNPNIRMCIEGGYIKDNPNVTSIRLSNEARRFMNAFDNREEVKPQTVKVTVLRKYVYG